MALFKLSVEPSFGDTPIAFDGFWGDAQHRSRLVHGQAAKETQFDDLTLSRVQFSEAMQSGVHLKQLGRLFRRKNKAFVKRNDWPPTATLFSQVSAGVIDQNVPHDLGGNREEVRTILPTRRGLLHQSQVGFVDECGGLQSMVHSFAPHVSCSHLPKFAVNQWHELGCGLLISLNQLG
jgi:hypothetical protein